MSNFTPTGNPTTLSRGASSLIRAEYTLVQTAVNSKADIAGQVYTGTHDFTAGTTSVATAALADNSTTAASTEFVQTNIPTAVSAVYAPLASPALTGTPTAPTAAPGTNTTQIATTAFAYTNFAPSASPAFTGTPTAPTATTGTSTTQLATTAFVGATAFNAALPSQTGNSGKFVTTDGSNASWATVAQPCEQTLTATGTLTDGMVVALRSDGTVEPVVQTTAVSATGAAATAHSANDTYVSACYDSTNQRVVVCYKSASDTFGYAVVGTVSGATISFGTPVAFTSAAITNTACCFDATNSKVVIAYYRGAGRAIVGTVSDTSISFGAEESTNLTSMGSTPYVSLCYNATAGKVVVAYRDTGNTLSLNVGTVSGTAISFGVRAGGYGTNCTYMAVASLASTATVAVGYTEGTGIAANIGTISGTTISLGSQTLTGTTGTYIRAVALPQSVLLAWSNGGTYTYCNVTANGTAAALTAAADMPSIALSGLDNYPALCYDATASKVLVQFRRTSTLEAYYITYTLSGSTLVLSDALTLIEAASWSQSFLVNDSTNAKGILVHTTSSILKARVQTIGYTSTNANNFLGISKSAVTNAAAQIATLGAKVTNQSGLTPNSIYYLTDTGTLSTTPNNRKIGKAVAATDLIIDTDDVSSGAWVLLSTVTAAGSATVDIEQTFSDAFDSYVIEGVGITVSATNEFHVQMKIAGAYDSGANYKYHTTYNTSAVSTYQGIASNTATGIRIGNTGASAGDICNLSLRVSKPSTSQRQTVYGQLMAVTGGNALTGPFGGQNVTTGVLTGLRFYPTSGSILSGTFRLYGIKK